VSGRAAAVAALALAVAGRAPAQSKPSTTTAIAAERFVPALGPTSLIAVEGASVTPWGQTSFAASLDELHNPITLATVTTGTTVTHPVRDQFVGDLALEIGFYKRLAVAIGAPVVLYQRGDRLQGTGTDEQPLATQAAGDLRVRLKAQLVGDLARPGLHAALILTVTAPMGGQSDFAASDGATIEPRLVGDWRAGPLIMAATVGVRFQRDQTLFTTQLGDELTWSAGAGLRLLSRGIFAGSAIFEAAGAVGPSTGTRPVELRGGVRAAIGRFAVDAGAGGGVDGDVGVPAWRVFLVARGTVGRAHSP
jgi:hypothetical protein